MDRIIVGVTCFIVIIIAGVFLACFYWKLSSLSACSPHLCVGFFFCSVSRPPPVRRPLLVLLSHAQLCHTQLFHTHLSFTHKSITHNSYTHLLRNIFANSDVERIVRAKTLQLNLSAKWETVRSKLFWCSSIFLNWHWKKKTSCLETARWFSG